MAKNFSEVDKDLLIKKLTNNLPILRAKLQISQEELASIIGISRQTYSSIETMKRKMSWSTFLTLVLFFGCNEGTATMLDGMGILSSELNDLLSTNNRRELL
ncbi:helix-turn-helix transcriptional regulator [Butyricicoccus pullicaecorum]|uniref:helix-turn-helix transcriptional regulator n=1 Tax=Butyricicoccus pullicaecorum TaxID=501571 RepID=UPI0013A6067F|nr:helix-turn-helix transcriptional regulator [Butyricicoccus pullicaecorum]